MREQEFTESKVETIESGQLEERKARSKDEIEGQLCLSHGHIQQ